MTVEVLRWCVLTVEGGVALMMLPAVVALLAGRGRSIDPARLRDMGNALLFIGFVSRKLFFDSSDVMLAGLYVATILWGAFTAYTAWAYGRGDLA